MSDVSTLTLNNGVVLPGLGLGVFQTPPDETRAAVSAALEAGYRHIDTAAAYGNERQVGEAVTASGLDRSEVFLETKIWISDYGYDLTLGGFAKSARKLGVDQIDLLVLHQARCPRSSTRRWRRTGRWRPCSRTARSARSGSVTSWSTTSPACSTARPWCRR
jgi:diketogulonate reductase-like aldo/keto reductase